MIDASTTKIRDALALSLFLGCHIAVFPALASNNPGFVQNFMDSFEASDITFGTADSNVPFPEVAFVGATHYTDVFVEGERGATLEYGVDDFSQAAGLPVYIGQKDIVVIGEYLSWTAFDVRNDLLASYDIDSFEIASIGLPVGWLRQVNPQWQLAAFIMPFGHYTMFDGATTNNTAPHEDEWSWQTMGGFFSRYVQNDQLWWAFGFYADVSKTEDLYLPYIGFSWAINQQWTLDAIMPWPAITYAPNADWFYRFGASPSSASWSIDVREANAALNLDAWDFGLSIAHRIEGNFWLSAEAGVGGFRSVRYTNNEFESIDADFSRGAFIGIDLQFRPSID